MAYFQQGVSNFLVGDFEEALANFNDTLLYLRGNNMIDYAQLGLMFKLYSCEVLFNRGLCYIYLQQKEAGMQDFSFAVKEKVVEDHNVIDEAIKEEAEVLRFHRVITRNSEADDSIGLHGLLHTCRCSLQAELSQSKEFEDKRLPWEGATCCRIRQFKRFYRVCWCKDEKRKKLDFHKYHLLTIVRWVNQK